MSILCIRATIEIQRICSHRIRLMSPETTRLHQQIHRRPTARSPLHTATLTPAEDSIANFNELIRDDVRRKDVDKVQYVNALHLDHRD
jgi:hypothetical protein